MRRRFLAVLLVAPLLASAAAAEVAYLEPNVYRLAGGGIRVTFMTEGGRSQPRPSLRYQDRSRSLLFTGDDLRIDDTALGTLVTATIRLRVDVDATTFTLVLPHVNLGPDYRSAIETIGITTVLQQPFAPQAPEGAVEDYRRVTRLSGTAQYVAF